MVNILGYELPTFSKQKENRGGGIQTWNSQDK